MLKSRKNRLVGGSEHLFNSGILMYASIPIVMVAEVLAYLADIS